jgi:hypothetical protein
MLEETCSGFYETPERFDTIEVRLEREQENRLRPFLFLPRAFITHALIPVE